MQAFLALVQRSDDVQQLLDISHSELQQIEQDLQHIEQDLQMACAAVEAPWQVQEAHQGAGRAAAAVKGT